MSEGIKLINQNAFLNFAAMEGDDAADVENSLE